MEGARGSDALRAARAAAKAAREEARVAAEQALNPPPPPPPEPEPLPVFVDLPAAPPRPPTPRPVRREAAAVASPAAPRERRLPTHVPWYPPAIGLWAAAFVLATTLDEVVLRLGAAAVLLLVGVGLVAADQPTWRALPPRATMLYGGAVLVAAVLSWWVAREIHPAAGAVLAAGLMTTAAWAAGRDEGTAPQS